MTVTLVTVTTDDIMANVVEGVCGWMKAKKPTPLITDIVNVTATYVLEGARSDSVFDPITGLGYTDSFVRYVAETVADYLYRVLHNYEVQIADKEYLRGAYRRCEVLTKLSRLRPPLS